MTRNITPINFTGKLVHLILFFSIYLNFPPVPKKQPIPYVVFWRIFKKSELLDETLGRLFDFDSFIAEECCNWKALSLHALSKYSRHKCEGRASYPRRSVILPCATSIERCWDGITEVNRDHINRINQPMKGQTSYLMWDRFPECLEQISLRRA